MSKIIERLGKEPDEGELRAGIDFLLEHSPGWFQSEFSNELLFDVYRGVECCEDFSESRLTDNQGKVNSFMDSYGHLAIPESCIYGVNDIIDSKKNLVKISKLPIIEDDIKTIAITQTDIQPIRYIRMGALSDSEFEELIHIMPPWFINCNGIYLWKGNNRLLQMSARGIKAEGYSIALRRDNEWKSKLQLNLKGLNASVKDKHGYCNMISLEKSLYSIIKTEVYGRMGIAPST